MRRRQLIQGCAAASCWVPWAVPAAGKPSNIPALLLAQSAPRDLSQLDLSRYLVSEKLDGVRAFWTGRLMFTRHGQPISLPDEFSAHLPQRALDGELWMARGRFDAASAAVRRQQPQEAEWRQLRYMLFELPDGEGSFEQRAQVLQTLAAEAGRSSSSGNSGWSGLQALPQERVVNLADLQQRLATLVQAGGEGLVLHEAAAGYQTGRQSVLLKLKPQDDDEAVVLAHLPGEGRLAGLLGALRLRNSSGVVFSVGTGFSDDQRRAPPPLGATITYRYRGLTSKGLPRFASFLRVQDV
jgi:DNA ligase-1